MDFGLPRFSQLLYTELRVLLYQSLKIKTKAWGPIINTHTAKDTAGEPIDFGIYRRLVVVKQDDSIYIMF
jgi:hypothetical protein